MQTTITVTLPAELATEPERIAHEMRALWLVERVRERRLGPGKAAELAQMPRGDFERLMGRHGVPAFDFEPGELDRELAPLQPR